MDRQGFECQESRKMSGEGFRFQLAVNSDLYGSRTGKKFRQAHRMLDQSFGIQNLFIRILSLFGILDLLPLKF